MKAKGRKFGKLKKYTFRVTERFSKKRYQEKWYFLEDICGKSGFEITLALRSSITINYKKLQYQMKIFHVSCMCQRTMTVAIIVSVEIFTLEP